MTQEHKLVSEALAEIDKIKTLPVANMLDKCLDISASIDRDIDHIEFNMDAIELSVRDGDGSDGNFYASVFKPSSIADNLARLEAIIVELREWARLHDLEIETDIDITKTIKEY